MTAILILARVLAVVVRKIALVAAIAIDSQQQQHQHQWRQYHS